jgi:hypothetical protein
MESNLRREQEGKKVTTLKHVTWRENLHDADTHTLSIKAYCQSLDNRILDGQKITSKTMQDGRSVGRGEGNSIFEHAGWTERKSLIWEKLSRDRPVTSAAT